MKAGATGGKRIEKIVLKIKNIEDQQASFEAQSSNLLQWIHEKTLVMQRRDFSNTLEGIQMDFKKFQEYRTVEKPFKYREKVEIEASFYDIQKQVPFVPPEGKMFVKIVGS